MLYNDGKKRGELMRYYSRRKETIKSVVYILVGVVGIYAVSEKLQALNIDDEVMPIQEVTSLQLNEVSEPTFTLKTEKIYKWADQELDEAQLTRLLRDELLGGGYFKSVHLQQTKAPYSIEISYQSNHYDQMLSKSKKDQIVLLDASILLSLYPEIDVVEVNIVVGDEKYNKVMNRPDLEAYFGVSIAANGDKNTFERIAEEFMDQECVSEYWNMKHPYDSKLGEDVSAFYKMKFPIVQEEAQTFEYIDEDLAIELVQKYGYKLFLEGLSYDNPLINYYCAYRLTEYYDSGNQEEIMLELATCETKSKNEKVQEACQTSIDLLSKLDDKEIRVFGRFGENVLGGGKKLYLIDDKEFGVFASWNGEKAAGLKVLSLSPDKKYVLCQANTVEETYTYVLPVDTDGEKDTAYTINENGVYNESKLHTAEMTSLLSERLTNQNIDKENVGFEWYLEGLMKVTVDGQSFIYNIEENTLITEEKFIQEFDSQILTKYLSTYFNVSEQVAVPFYKETTAKTKKVMLGENQIIVREYDSMAKKNIEQIQKAEEEKKIHGKRWSKGKIIVHYSGSNKDVIRALDEAML